MLTNQLMRKGKTGLFGMIESSSNLRNSRVFVVMTAILFAIAVLLRFTVTDVGQGSYFMWFSAGMLLVSLVELLIVQRKDGVGNSLKWILGVSFVVSAAVTTSTLGTVGSVIYVFPLLLSVSYYSVLFSLAISAITVVGTFIPFLLSAYLSSYNLNVVQIAAPGTVIKVTSSLREALDAGLINETGTKINELLSILLPLVVFIIISAVMTVSITAAARRILLEQYHQFQTTRE